MIAYEEELYHEPPFFLHLTNAIIFENGEIASRQWKLNPEERANFLKGGVNMEKGG